MKTLSIKLMLTALLAFSANANAQIKNSKIEVVTVYGNCGMCENNIETAGNINKIAKVDWDKNSKLATISYDSAKTTKNEVLKRIALAGYDSDAFLAPDDVYNNLHGCCQYERTAKVVSPEAKMPMNHKEHIITTKREIGEKDNLQVVFDNYFELKDALVNSNSKVSTTKASNLLVSIEKVEMDKLEMKVHMVWMKVLDKIKSDSNAISSAKDLVKQRKHFMTLSTEMYSLMKISNLDTVVYYQFCPMANEGKGANWLSKANEIKNPYYGAAMMSCGKTIETLK